MLGGEEVVSWTEDNINLTMIVLLNTLDITHWGGWNIQNQPKYEDPPISLFNFG